MRTRIQPEVFEFGVNAVCVMALIFYFRESDVLDNTIDQLTFGWILILIGASFGLIAGWILYRRGFFASLAAAWRRVLFACVVLLTSVLLTLAAGSVLNRFFSSETSRAFKAQVSYLEYEPGSVVLGPPAWVVGFRIDRRLEYIHIDSAVWRGLGYSSEVGVVVRDGLFGFPIVEDCVEISRPGR